MGIIRLLTITVSLAWFGAPAWGQSATGARPRDEPKAGPDSTADEPMPTEAKAESRPRPNFLGDTSRFTRMGGWGSIGGAIGQFGFAKSMLVTLPPVQEELKLTDKQKALLRDWAEEMRERSRDMGRDMRPNPDAFRGDVAVTDRIAMFGDIMSRVSNMAAENEKGVLKILDTKQRNRLNQLALQMEGAAALARDDVARVVNLSPPQRTRINEILGQARLMQMTTWVTQLPAMAQAGRRGGPTGPEAPAGTPGAPARRDAVPKDEPAAEKPPGRGPDPAKVDENQEDRPQPTPAERAERAKRREAFQKRFADMRTQTDRFQDRAAREIIKLLTPRQRTVFDRLLGEPFDPAAIATLNPRPRDESTAPPRARTDD